jgi:peptidoglycan/LPS O-acetylase OafA/YrhL
MPQRSERPLDSAVQPIHLPGLNGLRAIAAIAVVISHLRLNLREFGLPQQTGLLLAQYGVTAFFALCGFLISFLLLKERQATGRIDVRRFYIRRILRIWPLYYLYLAIASLVLAVVAPQALPGSLPLYFVLLPNVPFIRGDSLPLIDHYWSLGVEEQFYAFWPLLLARIRSPFAVLPAAVVVFLIAKAAAGYLKFRYQVEIPWLILSVNRFDCMLVGAIGAVLVCEKSHAWLRLCGAWPTQAIAWTVLALVALELFQIHPLVNHEIVAAATTLIIVRLAGASSSRVWLDRSIFDFAGKISFGIYIYHPLVILALATLLRNLPGVDLTGLAGQALLYCAAVGATMGVAWVSYAVMERPILRFKTRYAVIVTAPDRS